MRASTPQAPIRRALPVARAIRWEPLHDSFHHLAAVLTRTGSGYPVFVAQAALVALRREVRAGPEDELGLLAGELCEDPASHVRYLVVTERIRCADGFDGDTARYALERALTGTPGSLATRGRMLVGWYRSRFRHEAQPFPDDVEAHLVHFTEPWQVMLLAATEGSDVSAAIYRVERTQARSYVIPFHELLEASPRGGGAKPSVAMWPAYFTREEVTPLEAGRPEPRAAPSRGGSAAPGAEPGAFSLGRALRGFGRGTAPGYTPRTGSTRSEPPPSVTRRDAPPAQPTREDEGRAAPAPAPATRAASEPAEQRAAAVAPTREPESTTPPAAAPPAPAPSAVPRSGESSEPAPVSSPSRPALRSEPATAAVFPLVVPPRGSEKLDGPSGRRMRKRALLAAIAALVVIGAATTVRGRLTPAGPAAPRPLDSVAGDSRAGALAQPEGASASSADFGARADSLEAALDAYRTASKEAVAGARGCPTLAAALGRAYLALASLSEVANNPASRLDQQQSARYQRLAAEVDRANRRLGERGCARAP